jgi:hypothetical protein
MTTKPEKTFDAGLAIGTVMFLSYTVFLCAFGFWTGNYFALETIKKKFIVKDGKNEFSADSDPSNYPRIVMTTNAIVFAIPSGLSYIKPLKFQANGDVYSYGRKVGADKEMMDMMRKWLEVSTTENHYIDKKSAEEAINTANSNK